jgi:hypothetical protein
MKKMFSLLAASVLFSSVSIAQVTLTSANFNSYAPTLTGTGASGNWNINAYSATSWNGTTYDGTAFAGSPAWIMAYDPSGNWKPTYASGIRTYLGIPSGGETLQSVTDRANTTTNFLTIGSASLGHINIRPGGSASAGYVEFYKGNGTKRLGYIGYNNENVEYSAEEGSHIFTNGNVGIGTTSPAYKLDVNGDIFTTNLRLANVATLAPDGLTNSLSILKDGNLLIPAGNVGIGTAVPSEKLSVNGNIRSKKIIVTQTGWADYVFDSSYQLAPLHQVEKYIQQNKHLPDVPSAAEVRKDGVDLGDNQAVLLKKIEELTLYIIEQNKELKSLAQKVERLEAGK